MIYVEIVLAFTSFIVSCFGMRGSIMHHDPLWLGAWAFAALENIAWLVINAVRLMCMARSSR